MRLQKFLAQAGIASRRKAEELIKRGEISVNGTIVTRMGLNVEQTDTVTYQGRRVVLENRLLVVLLNKPVAVVSTVRDQFGRTTVMDLLGDHYPLRLYPVGRLDYSSSGLILLTNDGDLTYALTHPKHHLAKTYRVRVSGSLAQSDLDSFARGLVIDGYGTKPCRIRETGRHTYEVVLYEGRNRQIRKMMAVLGFEVLALERRAMGTLTLEGLASGEHRLLSEAEIEILKKEAGG
ncbi:MAG: hypothetical protein AVO33_10750 [delta proteobacterium ML8_F1]|nr:MAG: hypothetical protein AVO33_10750 [delta proteobacterium ML8_F1]